MPEELDVLFYAHDGRGHGHLSRTVAIALALRRLRPELRLLLVTGSRAVSELDGGKLDWLKLPAYRSTILEGRSAPETGPSALCHHSLALVRSGLLADIVARLRPRCVLVDHLPLGKADELQAALSQTANSSTRWVLGVRAVPGGRSEPVWTKKSAAIARQRYVRGLWYGDSAIHGHTILSSLREHLGIPIVPTGLVSRAAEVSRLDSFPPASALKVGVVGLSWASVATHHTLATLVGALGSGMQELSRWYVFGGPATGVSSEQRYSAAGLTLLPFGPSFLSTLKVARLCITYAGYNSITDCLWAGVPALLVIRDILETEQCTHADSLKKFLGAVVDWVPERSLTPRRLTKAIQGLLRVERLSPAPALLSGSEAAARELVDILGG
jgi:predicted glycosyltransferase